MTATRLKSAMKNRKTVPQLDEDSSDNMEVHGNSYRDQRPVLKDGYEGLENNKTVIHVSSQDSQQQSIYNIFQSIIFIKTIYHSIIKHIYIYI